MAVPVIIPRVGNTVETCLIGNWKKQIGDAVKKGEVLLEIETDKTVFELESPAAGVVLTLFFKTGDLVPVLTNIAVIGEAGEAYEPFRPQPAVPENRAASVSGQAAGQKGSLVVQPADRETIRQAGEQADRQTLLQTAREEEFIPVLQTGAGSFPGISPRAEAFLKQHNMPLNEIRGSGPAGRILERDVVQAYYKNPRFSRLAGKLYSRGWAHRGTYSGMNRMITRKDLRPPGVSLSTIRAAIAGHMRTSLAETAQYTLTLSARADALLTLRKKIKPLAVTASFPDISINDMVMYALIQNLKAFPGFNAELIAGTLYAYQDINLGFACDTPRGLLVPVLKQARYLTLPELCRAAGSLRERAKKGNLQPDELTGGTFTVTNMGSMGIESFTPILNAPQVAILGICSIELKPVRVEGKIEFIEHITLCLTVDHQVIDGVPAARFLGALKELIENFNRNSGLDI